MNHVLWLSKEDIQKTGVCEIQNTVKIVEEAFRLFDGKQAVIVPEGALRLHDGGQDQACYSLPAYVGGSYNVCGLKWTAHGSALDADSQESRIQATLILNEAGSGVPLAVMNGTEIGAARTGAVTAVALQRLAPLRVRKVALCGAGGQAEHQLQAILYALPKAEEVAIWSRGYIRAVRLAERYRDKTEIRLRPVAAVDEAVDGADVIIGATSAPSPYLTAERVGSASLYCHIGFHEISGEAVNEFQRIIVDTWEEAKNVSGQSLFRLYRDGLLPEERITGTLGAMVAGRLDVPRGDRNAKVMFDAFGLPIFDISVAKAAYQYAAEAGLGREMPW